ncbi:MAG: hypothetical protein IT422_23690 [Pirellulaceae bacterium]|nr:hypothetical protein [Pirellulaceae bacterium]
MPSDLEKFLQQAAERLAQKVNEAQRPPPKKPPIAPRAAQSQRPPKSIRSSERRPMAIEDEIVEAEVIETSRREDGPNPLSSIDTRPGLAQAISQTDERMAGHMHDVFDHDVSKLRKPSAALKSSVKGETEKSIDLHRREQQVSPFIQMLRQPDSLKAAFIASEVFKRKF